MTDTPWDLAMPPIGPEPAGYIAGATGTSSSDSVSNTTSDPGTATTTLPPTGQTNPADPTSTPPTTLPPTGGGPDPSVPPGTLPPTPPPTGTGPVTAPPTGTTGSVWTLSSIIQRGNTEVTVVGGGVSLGAVGVNQPINTNPSIHNHVPAEMIVGRRATVFTATYYKRENASNPTTITDVKTVAITVTEDFPVQLAAGRFIFLTNVSVGSDLGTVVGGFLWSYQLIEPNDLQAALDEVRLSANLLPMVAQPTFQQTLP